MDAAAFEQVYGHFGIFYFAPLYGRRETRNSGHYLQALLVQSGERRNAEPVGDGSGVSPRDAAVSHRFSLGMR